jgi:uncharacterized membrane protein YhaH (DUF805 family)
MDNTYTWFKLLNDASMIDTVAIFTSFAALLFFLARKSLTARRVYLEDFKRTGAVNQKSAAVLSAWLWLLILSVLTFIIHGYHFASTGNGLTLLHLKDLLR